MKKSDSTRGLSLLETVLALFVLISAFTVVLTLFLRSNQSLVQIEEKALAVAFSETVLDDLRVWARDYDNWDSGFGPWSATTLPQYPGFTARVSASVPTVLTPCTQLEVGKPTAEQREMRDSFRDLEIIVEHRNVEVFRLHTRLAEPERMVKEVVVTLVSGNSSLSPGQKATYKAELVDKDGKLIEDVSFHWSVLPDEDGNGTIRNSKTNYSEAELENVFVGVDGMTRYITGRCRLNTVARYRGREYFGQSQAVTMVP